MRIKFQLIKKSKSNHSGTSIFFRNFDTRRRRRWRTMQSERILHGRGGSWIRIRSPIPNSHLLQMNHTWYLLISSLTTWPSYFKGKQHPVYYTVSYNHPSSSSLCSMITTNYMFSIHKKTMEKKWTPSWSLFESIVENSGSSWYLPRLSSV